MVYNTNLKKKEKGNTRKLHLVTETEKLLPVIWNITDTPDMYGDAQQSQEASFTNKNNMTSSYT